MRKKPDSIVNGFDSSYYLLTQPDVAAAGVDPLAHFNATGWHEGRMPDGLFDPSYYLSQNPDVAAAGVNPLQHYLQRGASEGRSPSAAFDGASYLAANPDVAAAGVNPLQHFLQNGAFEGRSGGANPTAGSAGNDYLIGTGGAETINAGAGNDFVIAAGGNDVVDGGSGIDTARFSSNFLAYTFTFVDNKVTVDGPEGHDVFENVERFAFRDGTIERSSGLIDDLYYYAQNPDVWIAGVDPAQHFASNGWHEVRNPNQYFDTAYYLAQNPDVAAAGVNPLEHYLTHGALEGRNPSTLFNSAAYLSANPDVAAAGVNPLQHFLQHGHNEGRSPLGTPPNAAPEITGSGTTLGYMENQAPTAINTILEISDADGTTLIGATVSITGNFAAGEDVLGFTDQNGITGSYNSSTGVLTLSGAASLADYQAALRSVTYSNASDNPSGAARTVSFQVDDGQASNHTGNAVIATVTIAAVNDAPAGANKTIVIDEDVGYTFQASDFGFSDAIDAGTNSLLAVKITSLPANGTLTLVTDANAVPVVLNQVINATDVPGLVFTPALNANGSNYASFSFKVQDNGGTANGGVDLAPAANTITVNVTAVDDAPSNIQFAQSVVVPEGSTAASGLGTIGTVSATDVEGNAFTFSLRKEDGSLDTHSPFQIDPNTGVVTISADAKPESLDYEVETHSFDLIVRATETGNPSVYRDQAIHVALSDEDETTASGQEGYIAGATVWIDENNNDVKDVTDYTVTTDAFGNFKVIGTHTGNMYLTGGTDIATGLEFTGVLRAPSGSTVLTPLTTLIANLVDGGTSVATASQQIAAALGLTGVTDLTTYDPVAASINGATQAERDAGQAAFAAGVQVYNTIVQASSLLGGAGATNAADAVVSVIADQLQTAAVNTQTVDLTQSNTLVDVINDASVIAAPTTTISVQTISDAADVISGGNTVIQDAITNSANTSDFLVTVAAAANVAQGDAAEALATAGATNDASSAKTDFTGANLDAAVTTASADVDVNAVAGVNGDGDVVGTAGADTLDGQGGNDNVFGGGGKDILIGGTGNDILYGDTLVASQASRDMAVDTADYSGAAGPINVQMAAGTVTGDGNDTLVSVEVIIGTNSADTYDASGYSATSTNNGGVGFTYTTGVGAVGDFNQFEGKGGNDTITGNGSTRISYLSATGSITANLQTGTVTGDASVGTDTIAVAGSVTSVQGSNFNDSITGRNNGSATTEQFLGMRGDDFIDGNGGFDRVRYDKEATGDLGITIDLGAGTVTGRDAAATAVVGTDTLRSIESIRATNAADIYDAHTFTATSTNGGGNNDQGNFNEFEGLGGDDQVIGNGNTRIAYYNATAGVTVAETGFGSVGFAGTVSGNASIGADTYTGVNVVRGSTFDDVFTGFNNGYNNVEQFDGYSGNDLIDGGLGFDRARYESNNGVAQGLPLTNLGLDIHLAAGTVVGRDAAATFNYGSDTLRGIESVRGTNSDDLFDATGFSTSSANAGGGANGGAFNGAYYEFNEFEGGGGNDDVTGNGGTRVSFQNSGAAVNVNLGTGATGSAIGTDTYHGGINAVRGSNFGDTLTGTNNATDTVEVFEGMSGNDTIDGAGGFDLASYQFHNTGGFGVSVVRNAGSSTVTGVNGTATAGVGTDTLLNMEGVRGTNAADTYNAAGFVGFNQFEGGTGVDDITGNGNTRIMYHRSAFGVIVDLGGGTVAGGDGSDVLHGGINAVWGSQFNDSIRGSSLNDTFTGNAGVDAFRFDGAFGNDIVTDFRAGGGPGVDDVLQLDDAQFANFNDVLAHSQQSGADTLITLDGSHSIRLQNVTLASLQASDFVFV